MAASVLVVDNHDSFTYNVVDLLKRLSYEQLQVCKTEQLLRQPLDTFSHILLSPGPDVPRAYPQLYAFLRQYYQHKVILGVCLGHQTLCDFFGARLYNLHRVRHGQVGIIQPCAPSPLFKNLPQSFKIGLYHSWAVAQQSLPPELIACAYDQDDVLMAVRHRTLPLFGVQFHPESFISEYGAQLLQNWLDVTMENNA
ncbi:anthranilate synthase component II [Spirabiliibacterium falconis]|uniref:anthranilate synthase component II n=1 Tax=Spirabiliibacterium falconis TaxID=572023 RepID=UPI001AAD4B7F|nr:anthranilate synthase component II [Spirabiliibacterium falconis]MBE2894494.1 anthranilate synthase component II [Spirabiliibacterium falconis]